jgi:hypothetical protein
VIVSLSRRELVMPWRALAMGANWGGSEDVMVAQGELWATCRLGEFKPLTSIDEAGNETATAINVAALSPDLEAYDLSANAIQVLRQYLAANGQEQLLALNSLAALTRIRAALAAGQAPK